MAHYYGNENYGYDDDEDMSFVSQYKKNDRGKISNELLTEMQLTDKNLHRLNRFDPNSDSKKPVVVISYGSGDVGTTIRNAVTGIKNINHKVGSANEALYYSVLICTGETGQSPVTLFYDSPEQYEEHLFGNVNFNEKIAWRKRCSIQRNV